MPDIEFNYGNVYVRFNIQRIVVPDPTPEDEGHTREEWQYDEYFMTDYEYQMIQQGSIPSGATWSDPLRSIERERLYEIGDRMLAKYRSYAPDDTKAQMWSDWKGQVHATVNQPNYPTEVTYPEVPE